MTVRFATLEDIPALIEAGRQYRARTRFRDYDYDPQKLAAVLRSMIESRNGSHCVVVAEGAQAKVIGVLIGCVESHIFSHRPVAQLVHYDVLAEHRMSGAAVRLLHAFRKWAVNRGAVELSVGVNSGVDIARTHKFLRRMGFVLTGGNYSMML